MSEYYLHLFLSCQGKQEDGVLFCSGIENKILSLRSDHAQIIEISEIFDKCGLFNKSTNNINIIGRCLHQINSDHNNLETIWKKKNFRNLEKFILMHKECSLNLRLELQNSNN